jgi:hypothetical protein
MARTYIVKVAADGRVEREEFDRADPLGQLQGAVGGYIERVPVPMVGGHDLFVNEDGLLEGLPINVALSKFVIRRTRNYAARIVGDGVFAGHDEDGEAVGLTEAECVDIERAIGWHGAKVAGKEVAR